MQSPDPPADGSRVVVWAARPVVEAGRAGSTGRAADVIPELCTRWVARLLPQ